tara:strand:- start:1579 stop:2499 length:921 start_codon:yes stop_codon:yes gene_type:complete
MLATMFLGACTEREPILRVACHPWVGYEPLYVAEALDYYADSTIRMVDTTSATLTLSHLRHNTVEAACLTLDEALTIVAEGVDLAVVLVMDVSDGADVILARPPITGLNQLRGKTIAVEKSAVGAVVLYAALEKAGLGPGDVRTLTVPGNQHEEVYLAGSVDAVVTFEPVKSALEARGAAVVFSSAQIPGRIVDVLVVRQAVLAPHSNNIRHLIQSYFHALDYIERHPTVAAQLMSRRLRAPPERVVGLFDGLRQPDIEENRELLSGAPAPLDVTAQELAEFLQAHDLLRIDQPVTTLSDASFLLD